MRITLILIFLFSVISTFSQNADSIMFLYNQSNIKDTLSVNRLNEVAHLLKNNNPKQSFKYANEAERLSDSMNYQAGKARSLLMKAHYYKVSSEFDTVLEYTQQSLAVYTQIDDKKGMAESMHVLGGMHYFLGNIEMAMDIKHKALDLNIELKDSIAICNSYGSLSTNYLDIGDYPKAVEYAERAVVIATEIENEEAASYALNNLGVVYEVQGNYPKALDCYLQSFKYDERHRNYSDASISASNIAGVFRYQGNYESAIEFCQKGIDYAQKVGNKIGLTYNYEYLGQIYKEQGNYDMAWDAHRKNMLIQEEVGNKQGMALSYRDIASLYVLKSKSDSALVYYNKSLKISKEIAYKSIEADCYAGIAQVKYNIEKFADAYTYSKKAYAISKNIGNLRTIKNSARILALSCEARGLFKEAFYAQVAYKSMSDSLKSELDIKKIANLEYQYKYEKEKEILELNQQRKDKLNAIEIKKHKLVRNILIVGASLMLLLLFIILYVLNQKREANSLLKAKNIEIANQAEELKTSNEALVQLSQFKEDMTNMIIHDFKNPLSAIVNISVIKDESRQKDIIKHSGHKMMNLVENILEVYKYESTKIDLIKEDVELFRVVNNATKEVGFSPEKRNLTFAVNDNNNIVVNADARLLHRIIVNIMANAVKYASVNSVITTSCFLVNNNWLMVEVHNVGSYIPPESQDLIFDKFGQIENKVKGKISSTGLGLTFCKLAVNAHGGEIGVRSDKEKGTTFWFNLPSATSKN